MTSPSHAELLREYLEQLCQPGGESRVPAWKDWVRFGGMAGYMASRMGGALAIGAALTLAACDDTDSPTGNNGGVAGVGQLTGTGGTSMVALYAAPMTMGGTAGWTSMVAEYAAPMVTGGAPSTDSGGTGGIGVGTRYGIPLGGQSASQGGAVTAAGGTSMVALYMAPMEQADPGSGITKP